MYCGKCGNQINGNAKFCNKCGNPVGGNNNQILVNGAPMNEKKSHKAVIAVAIIVPIVLLIAIVGFVVLIMFAVFSTLGEQATEEYVDLSGDEIPTMYYVVGRREVCSYNTSTRDNEIMLSYEYCDGQLNVDDYIEYEDYLLDIEGFTNSSDITTRFIKESVDDNMYLEVEIDRYTDTITYYKYKLDGGDI